MQSLVVADTQASDGTQSPKPPAVTPFGTPIETCQLDLNRLGAVVRHSSTDANERRRMT